MRVLRVEGAPASAENRVQFKQRTRTRAVASFKCISRAMQYLSSPVREKWPAYLAGQRQARQVIEVAAIRPRKDSCVL